MNGMVQVSAPPADSRILTTWFPNMRLVQLGCRNCGIVEVKMTKEIVMPCPDCGEMMFKIPAGTIFPWCDKRVTQ